MRGETDVGESMRIVVVVVVVGLLVIVVHSETGSYWAISRQPARNRSILRMVLSMNCYLTYNSLVKGEYEKCNNINFTASDYLRKRLLLPSASS